MQTRFFPRHRPLTPDTCPVLNGNVISTGGAPTTVRAYWGTTDQHPNYNGWLGTNDFGAIGEGTPNCTASSLAYNTAYVYRYYATNIHGEAWGAAEPFTTPFPTPTTLYFNKANDTWHSAANWDPVLQQRVPMYVDTAYIRDSRIATIGADAAALANTLNIGVSIGAGGNAGTLNVLGTLDVGGNVRLASGHTTWGYASATVDQGTGTAVTVGGDLTVGNNYCTAAGGVYLLGTNASLAVTGNVKVATGDSSGGALVQSADSTVDITGDLYLGNYNANVTTSYGAGGVCIVPETATLNLSGASSSLYIAYGQSSRGTLAYNSTVGTLNIPGSVVIGSGDPTWGHSAGTLALGPGAAIAIGGNLTAGTSYSSTGDGGVVNIAAGATLTVAGTAAVASGASAKGAVNVTVGNAASGLILNGSSLTVGSGSIAVTFAQNPPGRLGNASKHTGIHYGLKWSGNRVATLTGLGAKLIVDDTTNLTAPFSGAASIFYDTDTDATYVGFYLDNAEPTTVIKFK